MKLKKIAWETAYDLIMASVVFGFGFYVVQIGWKEAEIIWDKLSMILWVILIILVLFGLNLFKSHIVEKYT